MIGWICFSGYVKYFLRGVTLRTGGSIPFINDLWPWLQLSGQAAERRADCYVTVAIDKEGND